MSPTASTVVSHPNSEQIRAMSGRFRQLFLLCFWLLPIASLAYWMSLNHLPQGFTNELPVQWSHPLSFTTLLASFVVSCLPLSAVLVALHTLAKLCRLYEQGVFFVSSNASCYRTLGWCLILGVLANGIFVILLSVVLSLNNPQGERFLVMEFGVHDVVLLVIGCVVIMVSGVMQEAARMNEELSHTV